MVALSGKAEAKAAPRRGTACEKQNDRREGKDEAPAAK